MKIYSVSPTNETCMQQIQLCTGNMENFGRKWDKVYLKLGENEWKIHNNVGTVQWEFGSHVPILTKLTNHQSEVVVYDALYCHM